MATFAHGCSVEHAAKFWDWITTRGGLAVWRSVDLSDPTFSQTTPALTDGQPTTKPSWKVGNEPEIFTDPTAISVSFDTEVKRFRVAVRRGSQGLSLKVTDGGSRRIRAAVAKAGEGAYHAFDYSTQEAVIFKPTRVCSLAEWHAEQQQGVSS